MYLGGVVRGFCIPFGALGHLLLVDAVRVGLGGFGSGFGALRRENGRKGRVGGGI